MSAVQTIEATGKKWKALKVLGGVIAGLFASLAAAGGAAPDIVAFLLLLAGGIAWITGRVGAWWNHG